MERSSPPRGSSYNKRSRHYLCTLETIPPTTTTTTQPHTESSAWKDSLINPLANLEPTTIPNSQANFFSEQADLNGHDSDTICMVQSMNHNCLQLNFLINNVEVKGIIDSGATCSVVISNCNMARSNETISYKIADGTTSQSLGTASGTLSIRLGSVTQIVHVKHKFSIVPGHETILIGADLLSHLKLMTNNQGIYIRMDDACRTLLLPEAEFDHQISQASEVVNVSTRWLKHINSSGCTINLDNDHFKKSLLQTLKEFEDVLIALPWKSTSTMKTSELEDPPRTLNPARLEVANQIFDELVDSGFAVPSNHEFSSPVCLVVYPDHRKFCLIGDYSGKDGVNANTIPVEPNLPRISDVPVFLSQANYIGTLDLPKAFWQLKIAEKDWQKTALSIPGKSIVFKRAAFGLKNVPAVFQNVMADIFSGNGVFIYIDDIIIIGSTFDEFIERLRRVLDQARYKRVSLGFSKCHFVSSRHPIKILGSVFQNKQRTIDPTRVESLLNLPKTIKDIRSLVGSVNFIREWLPQVSELIAPIIRLTKKDGNNSNIKPKPRAQRLQWIDMHDGLLQKIKQLIAKHMPLSLSPLENQILISCDASDIAVGSIIWKQIEQVEDPGTRLINRKCRPIRFFSRLLTNSQKNWPTNQKELYDILLMLTQSGFENYLKGRKLVIFTDHQNLTYMFMAPEKNRIVTRCRPIFSKFCFDLVHTKGEDNFWADMLSRIVPPIDHQEIKHLSHQMPPNFHPIFYIDKIDGTENEKYYIEDLNNFERIMVIRERCSYLHVHGS
ncbi:hypothetical protein P9112_002835 [Eukaryota sp. TZLM1-RC]